MKRVHVAIISLVAGFVFAGVAVSQPAVSPYPGAASLDSEQRFMLFQALEGAASAGVPAEVARQSFSPSAFTTASPADSVAAHLAIGAVETYEETVLDADSTIPGFLASLEEDRLDDLARTVGSDLSGLAYRDALIAHLAEKSSEGVAYTFIAHEHDDGSLTYYEIHRPYMDVGRIEWVDATRIRVIRLFPNNR